MRKPVIMGNWKLNGNKTMAEHLVAEIKKNMLTITRDCDVIITPPIVYLDFIHQLLTDSEIKLGAQNVDATFSGAFTGDISAIMLKEVGVTHAIIGHSEYRQYHSETDQQIAKKFAALKQHDLIPVLCIGETKAENEANQAQSVCAKQIDAILEPLGVKVFKNAVVAYEPIWAIGTGQAASSEVAEKMHKFIRNHIAQKDSHIAQQVTILYGGSVNEENAKQLFTKPNIDGALVGSASLKADTFIAIIKAAIEAKTN